MEWENKVLCFAVENIDKGIVAYLSSAGCLSLFVIYRLGNWVGRHQGNYDRYYPRNIDSRRDYQVVPNRFRLLHAIPMPPYFL